MNCCYLYKFIFLTIWATLCCPFSLASCDLKINNASYFFNNGASYKVNMNVVEACSSNIVYKRNITKIEMNIFKDDKKLLSYTFSNGLWMPSQSKFYFKFSEPLTHGCFKGAKTLMLNLKSNVINSINGHYFNLFSGDSLNINCSELNQG